MLHKITVIIPAYNVEEYIQRCLDSVLHSTYQNIEIIAIDDGSTDKTGEILDAYRDDPRVLVIHQKNQGLVAVREVGIASATGDFVGFVDGDDAVDPDMYERLLNNLLEAEADISHCGLCVYLDADTTELHYGTGAKMVQSSTEALRDLLQGKHFDASLCNKLYRRELLADSCLDASIQNNEDLLRNFVLFSRAKSIVFEDFCGYQYWSRQNSMSNDSRMIRRTQQVIQARKCIAGHASDEVKQYAVQAWLSAVVNAVNSLTFVQGKEAAAVCRACRRTLHSHRDNIKFLIRRQQLAAYLILYAPWLHRIVYQLYTRRRDRDA